jgi:hypothetical protein
MNKVDKVYYSFWIFFLLAILVLFSCTSAPKHLAKAIGKDKPYVAEQTRILWPCVDIKADTVTVTDSLYEFVECPETSSNDFTKGTEKSSDNLTKPRPNLVPVKVPVRNHYITQKVEDSAKIFLMQNHIEKINQQYEKQLADSSAAIQKRDAEIVKKDAKIEKQKKAIRILLIPWILIVLYVVYRIIKRK